MGFQARTIVRAQPYRTQQTLVASAVANAGTLQNTYDVSSVVSDRNQLKAGLVNSLACVGPFLDVMVFSDQLGTLDIQIAVDRGGGFRTMLSGLIAVPASSMTLVTGLRIPARYVNVVFTNTSGVGATVDFGTYVGSV
jgi:hypothetical protein